jgi:type I restriction enzyme S subunit
VTDWPTVKLGEVLAERRPRVPVEPETDYLMAGVFGFGRGILLRGAVRGSDISAQHLFKIAAGQIVYSRLKAFEGAFALVPPEGDGRFVTNEFPTFDVDEERALPGFVALVLSLPATWQQLAQRITGVGARRERLQVTDFLDFEVDLPPLRLQERTMGAVKVLDQLTDAAERAAAASALVLQATQLEMWDRLFEDAPIRRLGDVTSVASGGTPSRQRPEYFGGEICWVKTGEVNFTSIRDTEEHLTAAGVANSSAKVFPAETVVVAMYGQGATRGRCGILERDMATNQACAAIQPSTDLRPRFLFHLLWSRYEALRAEGEGSSQANLNKGLIEALEVPVPPLDEQERVIKTLDRLLVARVAAATEVEALRKLRRVLVEDLVAGIREVPDVDLLQV